MHLRPDLDSSTTLLGVPICIHIACYCIGLQHLPATACETQVIQLNSDSFRIRRSYNKCENVSHHLSYCNLRNMSDGQLNLSKELQKALSHLQQRLDLAQMLPVRLHEHDGATHAVTLVDCVLHTLARQAAAVHFPTLTKAHARGIKSSVIHGYCFGWG